MPRRQQLRVPKKTLKKCGDNYLDRSYQRWQSAYEDIYVPAP